MSVVSLNADDFCLSLAQNGIVPSETIQRVHGALRTSGQPIDVVITELGVLKDSELADQLVKFIGCERGCVDLDSRDFAALAKEVGLEFAQRSGVLPIRSQVDRITIGVSNPFDQQAIDAVAYLFDRETNLEILTRAEIAAACGQVRSQEGPLEHQDLSTHDVLEEDAEKLQDIALSAPVVSLVTRITQRAFEESATDIHIEPLAERVQIRIRKDGMLVPLESVSKAMHAGIASRVKILARLNIVERRLPQDGRMRLSIRGQEVDFRVSVVPSAHGETLALRLLHNHGMSLELEQLGYDMDAREELERLSQHANGIVVVTGPTGSGKTTTLYSILTKLNQPERKIFTVEDPVEYRMDGITQLQVNPQLGLDFARALRSILRQDPDIILIGEIRDRETAQIAIQAALTGHLVLTTLHTNSAAGALTRLLDMGVEPYLIGATVRGIVAQRLVRKVCPTCRAHDGVRCTTCGSTGYWGRTVAYEIMSVSQQIRKMVSEGQNEVAIERQACTEGMLTLASFTTRLVNSGITTASEIARVIGPGAA